LDSTGDRSEHNPLESIVTPEKSNNCKQYVDAAVLNPSQIDYLIERRNPYASQFRKSFGDWTSRNYPTTPH